jgi:hypothetical protein
MEKKLGLEQIASIRGTIKVVFSVFEFCTTCKMI